MRSTAIEIDIKPNKIPQAVLDADLIDYEYSSKNGYETMWIHDDGFKPFDQETEDLFDLIDDADAAYNRKFKTDHLDLYIETLDEIDPEYDLEDIDGKKFKNTKFEDWGSIDKTKLKTKKDIKDKT